MVPNCVAQQVLNKWTVKNEKKMKELVIAFLVQGINSKGKFIISVVNEDTKKRIADKWKNFKEWIYSIDLKSNSPRSIDLPPQYEAIKV